MRDNYRIMLAERLAFHYIGIPYRWGGDDPSGFDCSGFVLELLQSIGLVDSKIDMTAQGFYNYFKTKEVKIPEKGCLVFFGASKQAITHIEFCIDDKLSIGASGGGSKTLTIQDAINQNAFIKMRPFRRRNDVVAFVDPFLVVV